MFTLILIFVTAVMLGALLYPETPHSTLKEYCNLECKENKIRDYSICC